MKMTEEDWIEGFLENVTVNPELGEIRWAVKGQGRTIDALCGRLSSQGYRQVSRYMNGKDKSLYAHRVIFYYVHNYLPRYVDHINGVIDDNRISNLRETTHTQNKLNSKMYKNNKSGYKGVYYSNAHKKWGSQIKINNKNINLGYFLKKEDAIKARKEAELKHYDQEFYIKDRV